MSCELVVISNLWNIFVYETVNQTHHPTYLRCRLTGRKPKNYIINIESSKVQYVATGNDVKIYMETSNGVQRAGKEYNKVSLVKKKYLLFFCYLSPPSEILTLKGKQNST